MIRVLLVDDHALVRMGFRMLLASARGGEPIEVVGESGTGEQACLDFAALKPDLVVMDLSMPGMGGLEAVRRLLAQDPKVRILALSAHEDTAHPRRVLRAGALGYLAKRSATSVSSDWLPAPSFCLTWYRWVPTVLGARFSASAICATLRPCASCRKTENSRSLSTSAGLASPPICAIASACAVCVST